MVTPVLQCAPTKLMFIGRMCRLFSRSPRSGFHTCTMYLKRMSPSVTNAESRVESNPAEKEDDFFGIISGAGVTDVDCRSTHEEPVDVFSKYESITTTVKPNTEKVYVTNFGKIRLDDDNKPKFHGEFDSVTPRQNEEDFDDSRTEFLKSDLFRSSLRRADVDNQTSATSLPPVITETFHRNTRKQAKTVSSQEVHDEHHINRNYIDEEYFGEDRMRDESSVSSFNKNTRELLRSEQNEFVLQDALADSEEVALGKRFASPVIARDTTTLNSHSDTSSATSTAKSNYFDEVYFEGQTNLCEPQSSNKLPVRVAPEPRVSTLFEGVPNTPNYFDEVYFSKEKKEEQHTTSNFKSTKKFVDLTRSDKIPEKFEHDSSRIVVNQETSGEPKHGERLRPKLEQNKTALDIVLQIRKENLNEKLSKGGDTETGRIMSGVPVPKVEDLEAMPEYEVCQLLTDNILYNEHDVVAIYKPYGLACQHSSNRRHHLLKFLPEIAKRVGAESNELYTVHRLDVGTTGVLLLAKTQRMAEWLRTLFKSRKIHKTYWAITKGIPNPIEGIINIPIAEGTIDGRVRMVLKPDYNEKTKLVIKKSSVATHEAVTHYKVLRSNYSASLMELKPQTGVTHQLRVHLGFGLGCPVLGDHKYSYITRLVPQRLPGEMLQRLDVRQSKVRLLPIHLHARSVVIPEVAEGQNIFIQAGLPKHMKWAIRRLKLREHD